MKFIKGDSIELEITINVNITDWKIRAEFYDEDDVSIKKANIESGGSVDEIEITDAVNGIFLIKVDAGETTNFVDKGFLEIEREDTEGKVLTIYQGCIEFKSEKITWETP